jgi:pSer/pThr/pTyr-binding forkhead associated (FHA) protein
VQVSFQQDEELETGVFRVRPATSRRSIAPSTQAPRHEPIPPAQNAPVAPPPQRPTTSPVARPWLVIDGERYPLIGAHTVIGRDELADVVLDDPGISRRHCEIRVTNDGPHLVTSIRDLGSTNGTFVNGQRITSTRLDEGDEITIGRTHAVFRPGKR